MMHASHRMAASSQSLHVRCRAFIEQNADPMMGQTYDSVFLIESGLFELIQSLFNICLGFWNPEFSGFGGIDAASS